jgi:5-methylcytosine-specific restriction endonuclease McrA
LTAFSKSKFERLAEVLGVDNPLKNITEVFEKAMDISLEKKDLKKKLARRLERERKRSAPSSKSCPGKIRPDGSQNGSEGKGKSKSRYIPSEVRERVLARAGHQCEYRGKDGTRCSSRTGLQIEHSRPFAVYRSHEERFLKALCKRHNLFQAERVYGAGFIRAKIEEKRRLSRNGVRQSFTSTLFH